MKKCGIAKLCLTLCLILGLTLSYFCAMPAGASVVLLNIAAFCIYAVLGMIKNGWKR